MKRKFLIGLLMVGTICLMSGCGKKAASVVEPSNIRAMPIDLANILEDTTVTPVTETDLNGGIVPDSAYYETLYEGITLNVEPVDNGVFFVVTNTNNEMVALSLDVAGRLYELPFVDIDESKTVFMNIDPSSFYDGYTISPSKSSDDLVNEIVIRTYEPSDIYLSGDVTEYDDLFYPMEFDLDAASTEVIETDVLDDAELEEEAEDTTSIEDMPALEYDEELLKYVRDGYAIFEDVPSENRDFVARFYLGGNLIAGANKYSTENIIIRDRYLAVRLPEISDYDGVELDVYYNY